ncbi:transmembrane domain-containing protein [Cryptosporidium canis]|uniref:Transmembrane domain-containing protein n=1 Tax=Cryptosporidium canis TaxID=195482 RepID=A0ABQ8P9W6_9CRYT|nr:transmembrane domain-containing protein [Cryptosporidium canis]
MIREETASSDFISDYSEENRSSTNTKPKTISRSFRLTLFMCLIQGFSERLFFNMLLFGHIWNHPVNYLNSEWMLFSQRIIGCIGFLFWSIVCNYLKPHVILSASFIIWGFISILQPFAKSFIFLLFCRYLLSFSYGALEPSVQVISANYQIRNSDMAKIYGAVSCYKSFGSFLSIAVSTMIYLNGSSEIIATYSQIVWIVTGGISILISIIVLISVYMEYRDSNKKSFFEIVIQENYYYTRMENFVYSEQNQKKDKITFMCIYLTIFAVGLLTNIISEIYNIYQITSSFSFERYDSELKEGPSDTYLLSLSLTYYALGNVVFLLGSAIGSLLFGILYGAIYNLTKRIKEKLDIDSIVGLGRKNSINILCLTSISAASLLLISLLQIQYIREIPQIARFAIIDIVLNSFNYYWIIPHLIAVFFMGALLSTAIEIIPRFQLVALSQFNKSAISYGFYLLITGLFSDPSLYKYIYLFAPDKDYIVSISSHLNFNIIPSIFHNPIKVMFSGQLINKIKDLKFPDNFIYYQELQMTSSTYSILLYSLISIIAMLLLFIKITVFKRNVKDLE